jgi:hypothetical protein
LHRVAVLVESSSSGTLQRFTAVGKRTRVSLSPFLERFATVLVGQRTRIHKGLISRVVHSAAVSVFQYG